MTDMTCLSCGATTHNGLVLCELCRYGAGKHFEFLPVYFRNLSRWRPGRAGSRPVPGSRVLYDGEVRSPDATGDRISDRLNDALTAMSTWARAFVDDRGAFPERPLTCVQAAMMDELPEEPADDKPLVFALLCAGLEDHLVSIATLEWAGEFVRDLGYHEFRLRGLIDLVPGWYAGSCQRKVTMDHACGIPLYVMPGLTWVTCSGCGSTTPARDHLEVILTEAAGWLARPKPMAEAIVALVDSEMSVPKLYTRIRQWAFNEDITPIHRTTRAHVYNLALGCFEVKTVNNGPARYRLGEVMAMVTRRDTRTRQHSQAS